MTPPPPPEGFRHITPIQVRWGDMDALGHVNNAVFLTYLEHARVHYLSEVGLWDGGEASIGPIMVKAVVDYKLPLFANDDVYVFTRCARLGNRSFETAQIVARLKDGRYEISAVATISGVVYDYRAGQSTPMPESWRERVRAYEPAPVVE